MMKKLLIPLIIIVLSFDLLAQGGNIIEEEVDPSKPTNLYTQINTNLESSFSDSKNLFGLRVNVSYAINPDNLVLAEVPFLYNDTRKKFGISDSRVRYFAILKRNITKKFIAIAPFTDITIPTGSYEDGLGTGTWSVAVGSVFGFVASPKLALFPGISYVRTTKPKTDLIPENSKFAGNGISFQFNASYSFSKNTFLFINPTPLLLNSNSEWKMIWSGELNLNHVFIPNKFKANVFWRPDFTNEINVIRLGTTFFL